MWGKRLQKKLTERGPGQNAVTEKCEFTKVFKILFFYEYERQTVWILEINWRYLPVSVQSTLPSAQKGSRVLKSKLLNIFLSEKIQKFKYSWEIIWRVFSLTTTARDIATYVWTNPWKRPAIVFDFSHSFRRSFVSFSVEQFVIRRWKSNHKIKSDEIAKYVWSNPNHEEKTHVHCALYVCTVRTQ